MKNKILAVFLFAATSIGAVATVNAAAIPGLYNTGFSSAGELKNGQANPASPAHNGTGTWTWSKIGANKVGAGFAQVGDGNQIGATKPWMADSSTSHWMTLSSDRTAAQSAGSYNWAYKFDMTGKAYGTGNITLRFLADDKGKLTFNGHQLAVGGSRQAWTTVSATGADFVKGINTLLFTVVNAVSITGLRVEFLSSSYATPVPAAIWLFGSALVGLVATRRKKATIAA